MEEQQPPSKAKRKRRATVNEELKTLLSTYYPTLGYDDVAKRGFDIQLLCNVHVPDLLLPLPEPTIFKNEVRRRTEQKRRQVRWLRLSDMPTRQYVAAIVPFDQGTKRPLP